MRFCTGCGAQLEDGTEFCSVCGQKVEPAQTQAPPVTGDGGFQSKLDDAVNRFTNTPDTTSEYSPGDINNNRVMAFLSYLWIFFIVPLIAASNSPYAKFHANQGLLLFLFDVVIAIVAMIPVVGWIISAVGAAMVLILRIIGIVNSLKGEAKELPLIGKYRIIK